MYTILFCIVNKEFYKKKKKSSNFPRESGWGRARFRIGFPSRVGVLFSSGSIVDFSLFKISLTIGG